MLLNQLEEFLWYRFSGNVIENFVQTLLEPGVKRPVTRLFHSGRIGRSYRLLYGHEQGLQNTAIHSARTFSWHMASAADIPYLTRRLG